MDAVLELPYGKGSYRVQPEKIIALGMNYRSHIQESGTVNVRGFDSNEPEEPILFPKLPSCIIGSGDVIVIPPILGTYNFPDERTDYEGELAVFIGQGGSNIPEDRAMDHVLGFTCANDVSQRNIQNGDRAGWFRGKSFDTFLPLGPRLVGRDEVGDPENLGIRTIRNGTVVQDGNTGQMIFSLAETIAFVSRNFTLREGDIILTGTPAGIGQLHHGDIVEVEISSIGTLTNRVVDPRIQTGEK
jgi:2-keto-4-pentenoate hydratase/2-oxohepta-3-ene-1,7-dioic acid hydratase in catechol pathway